MPAKQLDRVWTLEEVLALPEDGNRYELVDGELLVSPGPRPVHQTGLLRLLVLVDRYVEEHGVGTTFLSPADLELGSKQRLQPDIFVAPSVAVRRARKWKEVGIPLLVVEVLSPRTAHFDRVKKRLRFQKSGVPVYWIVDLDARVVEVWTPDADRPAIVIDSLSWRPVAGTAPFVFDLHAYFAGVLDAR